MATNNRNKEIRAKIIAKAWKDETFRALLLSNPKEAFKEFGIELSGNVEMKVYTEDANHLYFVLPQIPVESKNLSTEELEKLAAAGTPGFTHCPSCCSCE